MGWPISGPGIDGARDRPSVTVVAVHHRHRPASESAAGSHGTEAGHGEGVSGRRAAINLNLQEK